MNHMSRASVLLSPGVASRGRIASSWMLWLVVAVGLLAGCDRGGPGTLTVTVEAPEALGAVSLEVVGPAVVGFEGMENTEVYGAVVSAREGRHRVVVVDPTGAAELRFGIRVEDVRAEWPAVRVVAAAGTDDMERITSDVEVSLARR